MDYFRVQRGAARPQQRAVYVADRSRDVLGASLQWFEKDGGRWLAIRVASTSRGGAEKGCARSFLARKLCYPENSSHAAHWSLRGSLMVVVLNVGNLFSAALDLAKVRCRLRARSSVVVSKAVSLSGRGF